MPEAPEGASSLPSLLSRQDVVTEKALCLRPEHEGDASFFRELFEDVRAADVRAWGELAATLVPLQLRAEVLAWEARDADLQRCVIVLEGAPVGRLVVAREACGLRLLHLSLLGRVRGLGLGSAMLLALQGAARRLALPLLLSVDKANLGARRLYERLGLVIVAEGATCWEMQWLSPESITSRSSSGEGS